MKETERYEIYCSSVIDICSRILQILEMPKESQDWLRGEIDHRRKELESM